GGDLVSARRTAPLRLLADAEMPLSVLQLCARLRRNCLPSSCRAVQAPYARDRSSSVCSEDTARSDPEARSALHSQSPSSVRTAIARAATSGGRGWCPA